ncbi:MAG: chromate transporter, partial [Gemmatimonadaceae bacterium]|nr:chromate transporter [Acetobacteraceae bacterium]
MAPPTCRALFLGFLGMGVVAFGGALPMARYMIVDQRRWLSAAEFTELLSLCQFLPGPNVVNLTVALGARFRGGPGVLSALAGLLAAPMAIAMGLGTLYARYGELP